MELVIILLLLISSINRLFTRFSSNDRLDYSRKQIKKFFRALLKLD